MTLGGGVEAAWNGAPRVREAPTPLQGIRHPCHFDDPPDMTIEHRRPRIRTG